MADRGGGPSIHNGGREGVFQVLGITLLQPSRGPLDHFSPLCRVPEGSGSLPNQWRIFITFIYWFSTQPGAAGGPVQVPMDFLMVLLAPSGYDLHHFVRVKSTEQMWLVPSGQGRAPISGGGVQVPGGLVR